MESTGHLWKQISLWMQFRSRKTLVRQFPPVINDFIVKSVARYVGEELLPWRMCSKNCALGNISFIGDLCSPTICHKMPPLGDAPIVPPLIPSHPKSALGVQSCKAIHGTEVNDSNYIHVWRRNGWLKNVESYRVKDRFWKMFFNTAVESLY